MKWLLLYPWPAPSVLLLGKSSRHDRGEPSPFLTHDCSRFVDDAFGFALTWNYWFNDAVSTASDLVALQLLLQYWTDNFPGWAISLIFLFIVIGLNIISVRAYGEVRSVAFGVGVKTGFFDEITG